MPRFDLLPKLHSIVTPNERKKLYWLTLALVFIAFFDMVGVASIFPFLKVVSAPDLIQTNEKLKWCYSILGVRDNNSFIIALGGIMLVILVLSNVFRALVMSMVTRITWTQHGTISARLLTQYLYEPYVFFLNRNSAGLTNHLMAEVGRVVGYVLMPLVEMFAKTVFILAVFILLVAVNPLVTLCVLTVMGSSYALVYFCFRNQLASTGAANRTHAETMYKVLNEAFGGVKDIKLLGREDVFIERFSQPAMKVVDNYCSQSLIATIPKYAFESLSFAGVLLITIYSVVIKKNYQEAVPMIGLYTLAAYRIIPALQQIFQSISSIRFGRSALDSVYEDMVHYSDYRKEKQAGPDQVLPFHHSIEFRNLRFRYPKAEKDVISHFNLVIKSNTTVGFVGGTGAGKTTVIDILLGLLTSQDGEIFVDGFKICADNLCMWQRNIGYVPQHIYLCDDTVTRNIAFGVPDNEIDRVALERAAQLANIHDFIMKELPQGYETEIGEQGIRLSGGQRQRIGIARAVYHNPSVIVFDEATSALDGITEEAILEAIHNLAHKKTIVIIAHRLSTVKECDIIYLIEQGRIVAQGTYEKLLTNNQQFRRMAKVVTGL